MNHSNRPLRRRLLAAVSATLLATCAALPPAAFAQGEPVKIGVLMPTKSVIGQQGQQGAELAAEMINDQGGILGGRKVQLIVYDSNFQPVEGVAAAQRLINQDRVKFIAGEISSTVALAVLQIARANNVLFMAAVPKHPDLTKSGYDKVFRLTTTLDADSEYFDRQLLERVKPQKLAVVAENTDYGRYVIEGSKKRFGDKFVAGETFELSQSDFSTLMTKVKASGADTVCIVAGKPEQAANALRAMGTVGLQARKCTATGVLNNQILRLAGDAAEGAFGSDIYVSTRRNPLNDEFVKRFQAKHGHVPEKVEVLGFESVWLTAKAMAAAGTSTDTAKVAEALHKNAWTTPRGEIRFDAGGQSQARDYVDFVAKGGKLTASQ
ncbi:ABC transporter substrate-binding protein [Variovorax sp. CY25R-8]|uniref:ABC transporter substrate-binding protein n=1 Tax=Variovorax sp. CY25R-8 TaxID=2855501 RepID=UPI000B0CF754|nr:ABC transporter substrate-binding protein [Variovorax sp. CY25R-8]MCT8178930.1 ABC transporter substrate-binding protein [Variovorax sp. CY25R-8]